MSKMEIEPKELLGWMKDNWVLYASTTINGSRAKLLVNNNGWFKVVYADETLYEGTQMTHVLAAWESI